MLISKRIFSDYNWILGGLATYQIIAIYLLSVGSWPSWVAWVNLGILALAMLLLPLLEGLLLFLVSTPFFIALPNSWTETLNMWRPLALILFARAFVPRLPAYSLQLTAYLRTRKQKIENREPLLKLRIWEWSAVALFLWAAATLLWARFPGEGVKQLAFVVNAALIYPITIFAVNLNVLSFRRKPESLLVSAGLQVSKDPVFQRDDVQNKIYRILKYLAASTGIIVLIGYGQLLASIVFEFYYFWQSWALNISSLYYGGTLANVFAYSNSWLGAGLNSLRMFSIMPSSHAFAVVCVFFLGFVVSVMSFRRRPESLQSTASLQESRYHVFQQDDKQYFIWILLTLSALAIALSGTRGVWVGMLPVLAICIWLAWKKQHRELLRPFIASMLLIVAFIAASPAINYGLTALRASVRGDSLGRAMSIIDLNEESNVGRLQIWKESLSFTLQHPAGVGFDNFITTLNAENKPLGEFADERNKRYNLPQKYITAHSLYLQLLVEVSVVGLVIFGLLWLAYFRDVWKWVRRTASGKTTGFVVCFSLVLLWFLTYSFFDLTWLNDKILLYTFVGLGVVRAVVYAESNHNSTSLQ